MENICRFIYVYNTCSRDGKTKSCVLVTLLNKIWLLNMFNNSSTYFQVPSEARP